MTEEITPKQYEVPKRIKLTQEELMKRFLDQMVKGTHGVVYNIETGKLEDRTGGENK